jgi:hypothetical protein
LFSFSLTTGIVNRQVLFIERLQLSIDMFFVTVYIMVLVWRNTDMVNTEYSGWPK